MSDDEVEIIVKILLTADGWCGACTGNLVEQFKEAFPRHAAVTDYVTSLRDGLESRYRHAMSEYWDAETPQPKPKVWEI